MNKILDELLLDFVKEKPYVLLKDFPTTFYQRAESGRDHLLPDKEKKPDKKWPEIPPLPMELFRTDPISDRRDLFYSTLNRGDVLYLQVVNNLPESYKLWVLAQHGRCKKVDDLGIVMHLPKLSQEMSLLSSGLEKGDFIRAALCSCSIHERKLFVTLDESLFFLGPKVKLGCITYHELPYFVGNIKNDLSYTVYIQKSKAFFNPAWPKQLCSQFKFDRSRVYSFFEEWNNKSYPEKEYASKIKAKLLLNESDKSYNKAIHSYNAKKVDETFQLLNEALALNPKNVQALTTRGTVHSNQNSLRKAFIDTEAALKINPTFEPALKQMSKLLIALARLHLEQGNYVKAQEALKMSSTLDGDNFELAKPLMDLIPTQVKNLNKPEKKIVNTSEESSIFRKPGPSSSTRHHSSKKSSHSRKKEKMHRKERKSYSNMKRRHHSSRHKDRKHERKGAQESSSSKSSRSASADSGASKTTKEASQTSQPKQ